MRSEGSIEKSCRRYAERRGCWFVKLQGGITGDPDRLVVLPSNYVWPVEFKRPKGPLSPRQVERHRELADGGYYVTVIDDAALFRVMLDMLLEATSQ